MGLPDLCTFFIGFVCERKENADISAGMRQLRTGGLLGDPAGRSGAARRPGTGLGGTQAQPHPRPRPAGSASGLLGPRGDRSALGGRGHHPLGSMEALGGLGRRVFRKSRRDGRRGRWLGRYIRVLEERYRAPALRSSALGTLGGLATGRGAVWGTRRGSAGGGPQPATLAGLLVYGLPCQVVRLFMACHARLPACLWPAMPGCLLVYGRPWGWAGRVSGWVVREVWCCLGGHGPEIGDGLMVIVDCFRMQVLVCWL
jgi:hypothetical protein